MTEEWDTRAQALQFAVDQAITHGDKLADRVEELEAKLAKAEAILEREIRRVQKIQEDLPPPHNVGLAHVEEEYILMLKELRGEYVDGDDT